MLTRNEDVASLIRRRNTAGPFGQRERGDAVQYDTNAASTARLCAPDQKSASGQLRDPPRESETEGIGQNGSGMAVQAFSCGASASLFGFCSVISQYAFVPAGPNDEIEITLMPRRWTVSIDGTKPPEQVFFCEIQQ